MLLRPSSKRRAEQDMAGQLALSVATPGCDAHSLAAHLLRVGGSLRLDDELDTSQLSPATMRELRQVMEAGPLRLSAPPLHFAAALAGDDEVLSLLLAAGADAAVTDAYGLTALHSLSRREDDAESLRPLAEMLVAAGTPLERREGRYGATALCYAAWRGNAGAASALLAAGAERDCDDAFGGTPLHWATQNGHAACARVLREAPPQAAAHPLPAASREAYRRSLQVRHSPRMESDARCKAAWELRLLAAAFEEATGRPLPGPAAVAIATLLMEQLFPLWPPVTRPSLPGEKAFLQSPLPVA